MLKERLPNNDDFSRSEDEVQSTGEAAELQSEAEKAIMEAIKDPSTSTRIAAFLRRQGIGAVEAEDAAQETLLKAWRNRERYDPARPLFAWLHTIARRAAIDNYRHDQKYEIDPDIIEFLTSSADTTPTPEQMVLHKFDKEATERALGKIDQNQADTLRMFYLDGMTHEEISDATGLALGTVKSRIRIGLKKLRALMNERHDD